MKTVTIKDLKRHLSALVTDAAAGEEILITRHRKPLALLSSAESARIRIGHRAGLEHPTPLLKAPTKGRYLDILDEDRRGDEKSAS